ARAGVPAANVDWPTYGYDTYRTGYNPSESAIGISNVGGLTQKWTYSLGAVTVAQPAVAARVMVGGEPTDVVYTGSEHGHLVALKAVDGTLIWDRDLGKVDTNCPDMPDTIFGTSGTPVIVRSANVLYEAGGDG